MLNSSKFIREVIDSGCLCYSAFSAALVRKLNLPRIPILERSLKLAEEGKKINKATSYITWANVDIVGHKERTFGYVIDKLAFPLILGDPWLQYNNVFYRAGPRTLHIRKTEQDRLVQESGWIDRKNITSANLLSDSVFIAQAKRIRENFSRSSRKAPKDKDNFLGQN
ncbi:hypothetical protein K3495_g8368 [Podosphaera aphanis]|nr:hypothetical protein K3495_g8368 [Podosphaera aphanis]